MVCMKYSILLILISVLFGCAKSPKKTDYERVEFNKALPSDLSATQIVNYETEDLHLFDSFFVSTVNDLVIRKSKYLVNSKASLNMTSESPEEVIGSVLYKHSYKDKYVFSRNEKFYVIQDKKSKNLAYGEYPVQVSAALKQFCEPGESKIEYDFYGEQLSCPVEVSFNVSQLAIMCAGGSKVGCKILTEKNELSPAAQEIVEDCKGTSVYKNCKEFSLISNYVDAKGNLEKYFKTCVEGRKPEACLSLNNYSRFIEENDKAEFYLDLYLFSVQFQDCYDGHDKSCRKAAKKLSEPDFINYSPSEAEELLEEARRIELVNKISKTADSCNSKTDSGCIIAAKWFYQNEYFDEARKYAETGCLKGRDQACKIFQMAATRIRDVENKKFKEAQLDQQERIVTIQKQQLIEEREYRNEKRRQKLQEDLQRAANTIAEGFSKAYQTREPTFYNSVPSRIYEQPASGTQILNCGMKPMPRVGYKIGRCVNGQWEQVSK
jgi:hypothetical protein